MRSEHRLASNSESFFCDFPPRVFKNLPRLVEPSLWSQYGRAVWEKSDPPPPASPLPRMGETTTLQSLFILGISYTSQSEAIALL